MTTESQNPGSAGERTLLPAYRLPPARPALPWWWRFARQKLGMLGLAILACVLALCIGSLPWTLASPDHDRSVPRYAHGNLSHVLLPPFWVVQSHDSIWSDRLISAADESVRAQIAQSLGTTPDQLASKVSEPGQEGQRQKLLDAAPGYALGTDRLGTSVAIRLLTGGGISLCVGLAAAAVSVVIGTLYGAFAGWMGGKVDAALMRIVDVLYGLPYVLIVVLLAVAVDAGFERIVQGRVDRAERDRAAYVDRELAKFSKEDAASEDLQNLIRKEAAVAIPIETISAPVRTSINLLTLLIAIGGVSWLTMARVVRGQVLSIKTRPYVDAARAMGAGPVRLFIKHLLPGLIGPIVVYATLTVPQAILQESFLSFLGIGVKPPLPSWGNMASEGLAELNPYRSHWWLIVFPCLMLAVTLLAMNFVGEGLRSVLTPQISRGGVRE